MDNLSLFFFLFGLSNRSEFLDQLMVFGAEYVIYLTFVFIFILAIKGGFREKKALLLSLICIPVVILIIKIIHLFFFEPRPFIVNDISPLVVYNADASFPSRHASIMSVIAFSYVYFKSKWTPIFLILLFWVGISRVYVGVHYPLDILGGILTAVISLIIAKQIVKFLKVKLSQI